MPDTARCLQIIVDPLFKGQVTLELSNVATLPIKLWPGMRIGQFSFHKIDERVERGYGHPDLGSKYMNRWARWHLSISAISANEM